MVWDVYTSATNFSNMSTIAIHIPGSMQVTWPAEDSIPEEAIIVCDWRTKEVLKVRNHETGLVYRYLYFPEIGEE